MTQLLPRRQRNAVPFGSLPEMPRSLHEKSPPVICRAIFEEMFILANGDIVCASPDPNGRRIYGNVNRDRIADIVNGPMYREIRGWQLDSQPDNWCPVTVSNCPRRVANPTIFDDTDGCVVTNLELEPVSACNVKCPECPVTLDFRDPSMAERAMKVLSLEKMNDIVDQLPKLQKIRLYGFGEPFLHKDLVSFLRTTKANRPEIYIGISTNGIPLTDKKIAEIAHEGLADTIVFAIDGVDQESYGKYRVGGKVSTALSNLNKMSHAVRLAGKGNKIDVVWQYILFEWNDSEDELKRASSLAQKWGVRLDWLPTHSEGYSKRYLPGSADLERLQGRTPSTGGGTAEVRLKSRIKDGGRPSDTYLASVRSDIDRLIVGEGGVIRLDVEISNLSRSDWIWRGWSSDPSRSSGEPSGGIRIGAVVQDENGKTIREIWSGLLPGARLVAGDSLSMRLLAENSFPAGRYRILVDVVDEGRCWFHERGSAPLVCEMRVVTSVGGAVNTGYITPAYDIAARRSGGAPQQIVKPLSYGPQDEERLPLGMLLRQLPDNADVQFDRLRNPPEVIIRVPLS